MFRKSVWPLRVIVFAAAILTLIARTSGNQADYDLWHEMALAREIFATGHIPVTDVFAYTPTSAPFVHHEWGAGVLAYLLAINFGAAGILALKYLLVAGVAAFSYLCARRRGGPIENWALLAMPAIWLTAIGFLPVRAQGYTFLAIAALLWCLQRDEEGSRKWILPWLLGFVIWANLHGGCAVAFPIVGAYWVERVLARKPHLHLLAVGAAMLLLLFVNPYGAGYPVYLWRALRMPRPQITEWQPVWASVYPLIYPFAACVAVPAYCLFDSLRRRAGIPSGAAVVALTAVMGAMHVKLLPLFAVAIVCCVPGWFVATPAGKWVSSVNRNWADIAAGSWLTWIIALVASGVLTSGETFWRLKVPGNAEEDDAKRAYPVAAVDYLRQQKFTGNLMTPFEFGAYCTWKLYPAARISLDGRYELVFSEKLFVEIMDFYDARPGWQGTLRAYKTDVVVLPVTKKLAVVMPSSGWTRVYSDAAYQLYARPDLKLPVVTRNGTPPDGTIP